MENKQENKSFENGLKKNAKTKNTGTTVKSTEEIIDDLKNIYKDQVLKFSDKEEQLNYIRQEKHKNVIMKEKSRNSEIISAFLGLFIFMMLNFICTRMSDKVFGNSLFVTGTLIIFAAVVGLLLYIRSNIIKYVMNLYALDELEERVTGNSLFDQGKVEEYLNEINTSLSETKSEVKESFALIDNKLKKMKR